jgi:hypothetical protein
MGNMSYCRFQNTHNDLEECVDAMCEMENLNGLSKSEKKYAVAMYDECRSYMTEFERLEEEES